MPQRQRDAGTEDALPLLAFTLRELYDRYVGERGKGGAQELSLVQYTALGDPAAHLNPLENSVRRRADEVLSDAQLSDEEMAALREAFIGGMVRIDEDGEYSRRPAFVDALPEKALPALERLAAARLVIFDDETGRRTVEAAHEALCANGRGSGPGSTKNATSSIGRNAARPGACRLAAGQAEEKTEALLRGLLLSRARQWLDDDSLNDAESEYVKASIAYAEAEERRRRMARRGLILAAVGVLAVIAIAGGLIWLQQRNIEAAKRETAAAERGANATLLAFRARAYLQAGDLADATDAAVTAVDTLSTAETRASLFEAVMAISPNLARSVSDATLRPSLLAALPGSQTMMIGSRDGRLALWKTDGGAGPQAFAAFPPTKDSGPRPPVPQAFVVTKVGGAIVALDDGRLVRLDATGNPAGETKLAPDIDKAALSADGNRLVIASQTDRKVSAFACNGDAGTDCIDTALAEDYATALAIGADGKRVALALQEAGLVLVDLADPGTLRPVALAGNPRIRAIAFDGKAEKLAVGTVEGQLFVIGADGAATELPKQDSAITALAWSPSGTRLAAACNGLAICVWDITVDGTPKLAARLAGHNDTIATVAWSSDGKTIVSADIGGTVDAWTVAPAERMFFTLDAPVNDPLTDIDLSADGHRLAAGTEAGTIDVWDLDSGAFAKSLHAPDMDEIRAARWHPAKPWLAAADKNGRVAVLSWPEADVIDEQERRQGCCRERPLATGRQFARHRHARRRDSRVAPRGPNG